MTVVAVVKFPRNKISIFTDTLISRGDTVISYQGQKMVDNNVFTVAFAGDCGYIYKILKLLDDATYIVREGQSLKYYLSTLTNIPSCPPGQGIDAVVCVKDAQGEVIEVLHLILEEDLGVVDVLDNINSQIYAVGSGADSILTSYLAFSHLTNVTPRTIPDILKVSSVVVPSISDTCIQKNFKLKKRIK